MLRAGIIIVVLFSLLGCGSPKSHERIEKSQTIRLNISDDPQSLDPRTARDLSSFTVARMLFEGLTRISKEEKAELALAESVAISSDQKTYTFYLKESRWTNGDVLKASDFAYAWKKVLSPEFLSDAAFQLYVIKNAKSVKEGTVSLDRVGIEVIDDRTLRVSLEHPIPYFMELIAMPIFFPVNQKVDESNPQWAEKVESYVGNGPFKLAEWRHRDHLVVTKNGLYWDVSQVELEKIELLMIKEETAYKMFEKGELDWIGSPLGILPLDTLQELRQEKRLQTKEMLGTCFLRSNVEKPPFNNTKMRRAFALAINRQEIVDHVTQGNQLPAMGLVPACLKEDLSAYFKDGDVEGARALFKEALSDLGMTEGALPKISLLYLAGERNHLLMQVLQQQWFEAFGVWVELNGIEGKVYYDKVSKRDYQLASGSWIADFNDPINFLEVFKYKNGGSNNTLWENLEYTRLLNESSGVTHTEKRLALLERSERILMEEMPIIPIFYYTMLYVNQSDVKDVVLSSLGSIDFKWAYIGEKQ